MPTLSARHQHIVIASRLDPTVRLLGKPLTVPVPSMLPASPGCRAPVLAHLHRLCLPGAFPQQYRVSIHRKVTSPKTSSSVFCMCSKNVLDPSSLACLYLLHQLCLRRSIERPTELQLTCLATQTYHLAGLEQGLHAFQPVVFPSPNLAVLFLTVHSTALQQSLGTLTYRYTPCHPVS